MTNEIIDKYLDQQGITPGEWEIKKGAGYFIKSTASRCALLVGMDNTKADSLVFANSRKSLSNWIIVAWESETDKNTFEIENIYKLATENIEASLGKPWSQVRAELEGMKG